MDESKPNAGQPEEQPESGAGDRCSNQNTEGDFTLSELLRAHYRNVDGFGRRVGQPEGDD